MLRVFTLVGATGYILASAIAQPVTSESRSETTDPVPVPDDASVPELSGSPAPLPDAATPVTPDPAIDAGAGPSNALEPPEAPAPVPMELPSRGPAPVAVMANRLYVEPSSFAMIVLRRSSYSDVPAGLADRSSGVLSRLAAGILLTQYAAGGLPAWRARLGLTLAVLPFARDATAGAGFELSMDAPVARHVRMGARGSVEGGAIRLYTIGSRIQLGPQLSIAVDLYGLQPGAGGDHEVGMMFGIALTGDLSRYVAIPMVALTSYIASMTMSDQRQ